MPVLPRNHASLEAGNHVVGHGLVDARTAARDWIGLLAVCHNILLACAARVGQDGEGEVFAFGTQPKSLLLRAPLHVLCGWQRRGGFGRDVDQHDPVFCPSREFGGYPSGLGKGGRRSGFWPSGAPSRAAARFGEVSTTHTGCAKRRCSQLNSTYDGDQPLRTIRMGRFKPDSWCQ